MSDIINKIQEYGQGQHIPELKTYMSTIAINELLDAIKTTVNLPIFEYAWNYILQGFILTDTESKSNRFKVVLEVLRCLNDHQRMINVPTQRVTVILIHLCYNLPTFDTCHLVELCQNCLESTAVVDTPYYIWKDLLPELLNILMNRDVVQADEATEITGLQFKDKFLASFCLLKWPIQCVTSIAMMIRDLNQVLTKDQHCDLDRKLVKCIDEMVPSEVPSLVYQLLKVCENECGTMIFLRLQKYFHIKLYMTERRTDNEETSGSTVTNNSGNVVTVINQSALNAESTVLYHIWQVSKTCNGSVRNYLKFLKSTIRAPDFILLQPFHLSTLLTVASVSNELMSEQAFDCLRLTVSRAFNERQRQTSHLWLQTKISNNYLTSTKQLDKIFLKLIEISLDEREFVIEGIVKFALVLLGVGTGFGSTACAQYQWKLGGKLLFHIVKYRRCYSDYILQKLVDRFKSGGNHIKQYIDCISLLLKNFRIMLLEHKTIIMRFMDGLLLKPVPNPEDIIDAIVRFTNISIVLRDHFILTLKKALYGRTIEGRQMAVSAYITMLKTLKFTNLSQLNASSNSSISSFPSGRSLCTQLSLNTLNQNRLLSFSPEALCLEYLGILHRCFVQQQEVRCHLYDGLQNAIRHNPNLEVPILEFLMGRFTNFYVFQDTCLPPVNLKKIISQIDDTVILEEPVSKLIQTMGVVLTSQPPPTHEDPPNEIIEKTQIILDNICERMIITELEHFQFDTKSNLLHDPSPECQQKVIALMEAMLVYDVLIGYKCQSWQSDSKTQVQQIYDLFQGYIRLVTFAKDLSQSKKPATNRKESKSIFKVPESILNLNTILILLKVLLVPESDLYGTNLLKSNQKFHQYVLQATIDCVNRKTNRIFIEQAACEKCIEVLFENVLLKFDDYMEFDSTNTVLALQCLYAVLDYLIENFNGKLEDGFLTKYLDKLIDEYEKLLDNLTREDTSNACGTDFDKLVTCLIITLNLLLEQIPTDQTTKTNKAMEWLMNFAISTKLTGRSTINAFTNLLFKYHMKNKLTLRLLETISLKLSVVCGQIDDTDVDNNDTAEDDLQLVCDLSAQNVFLALCTHLKQLMDDIEWLIVRIRAEYVILTAPLGDNLFDIRREALRSKEKAVSCQLCFLTGLFVTLTNCTVPPGAIFEALQKLLVQFYGICNNLTKYFVMVSSKENPIFEASRFGRLVKLVGKDLSPSVNRLVLYMEKNQQVALTSNATVSKTKCPKRTNLLALKNKVLKQTRLLPKTVYEMEEFTRHITNLTLKTKIDLTRYVGQGTTRAFRIRNLKEILEQQENDANALNSQDDVSDEDNDRFDDNSSDRSSTNVTTTSSTSMVPPQKKYRKLT